VGNTGFEVPRQTPGKIEIGIVGGAESGALSTEPDADPLLAMLVREWPRLTPEARLRIMEIAAGGGLALRVAPRDDGDGSSPRSGKTKFRRHGSPRATRSG
jgi:hypothetical protein